MSPAAGMVPSAGMSRLITLANKPACSSLNTWNALSAGASATPGAAAAAAEAGATRGSDATAAGAPFGQRRCAHHLGRAGRHHHVLGPLDRERDHLLEVLAALEMQLDPGNTDVVGDGRIEIDVVGRLRDFFEQDRGPDGVRVLLLK